MTTERLHRLLTALPDSGLPADLVKWLSRGLQTQQAGGDLLAALELAGPDLDRRDGLIRAVIGLAPGESLTARCAFVISCLDGHETHPHETAQRMIETLRLLSVPRSVRQLSRIMAGRRQDGWHCVDRNDDLCPT